MQHSLDSLIACARAWSALDPDAETRGATDELIARADFGALTSHFGRRLRFGTAGIRATLGPGPGFLNRRLVGVLASALAEVLATRGADPARGVVVACDARRGSESFAREACEVLSGAGFRVWRFGRPTPTPVAAFATRVLGAAAGVVVTASHNPPAYNGVKVYIDGGRQILAPLDSQIALAMQRQETLAAPRLSLDAGRARGLLVEVDAPLEAAYLHDIACRLPPRPEPAPLRVVYTPLHGVGGAWAVKALEHQGVEVLPVPEQMQPDGAFPTVSFPNPEEAGALDLAFALADARGAPLVLANDPDADRLALAARDATGALCRLAGDELGILLADHLLRSLAGRQALPARGGLVTTVVSSGMLAALARVRGLEFAETLTGFKWIAQAFERFSATGVVPLFGYEEALGYLIAGGLLDKDGLSAAVAAAQLGQELQAAGQTMFDRLDTIQAEIGVYVNAQRSIWVEGDEPLESLALLMRRLREEPPAALGGHPIERFRDYSQPGKDGLPTTDMLSFATATLRLRVRPSGTEPKLKLYAELRGEPHDGEAVAACRARQRDELQAALAQIHTMVLALVPQ